METAAATIESPAMVEPRGEPRFDSTPTGLTLGGEPGSWANGNSTNNEKISLVAESLDLRRPRKAMPVHWGYGRRSGACTSYGLNGSKPNRERRIFS